MVKAINLFYLWLFHKIIVDIQPGMYDAKPALWCDIHNNSRHTITVNNCHLIVDGHHSPLKCHNLPLPYTFLPRNGAGFCFDAAPLLSRADELGQEKFKVQALFQASDGRTWLSKPITIDTHPKGLSIFESQYQHSSETVDTVFKLAEEATEQLDQQLVKIPHVLLGLIQEETGVGGSVLRELGLQEAFLLDLAKSYHNTPRDYQWPQPHRSMETHELFDEYMTGEGRKMRHKRYGTGHLLLGLTKQKNEAFLSVLEHLEVRPRQVRKLVYRALQENLNPTDHPDLPPQGVKRYIWALSYSVARKLYVAFARLIMWLFPDLEI